MMPLPQNSADLQDLIENVDDISEEEDISQVRGNYEITLNAQNPFRTAQSNPATQLIECMADMPEDFANLLSDIKENRIQSDDDDDDFGEGFMAPGGFDDDDETHGGSSVDFEQDDEASFLKEQARKRKMDPDWDPNAPIRKKHKKRKKPNAKKSTRKKNFRDHRINISDNIWSNWLQNTEDLVRDPLKTHCCYYKAPLDGDKMVYESSFVFGSSKRHRLVSLLRSKLKRKFSGAPIKRKRARRSLSNSSDSGNYGGPISFGDLPQFGGNEEQSNDSSEGADKELAKAIMEEEITKLFPK